MHVYCQHTAVYPPKTCTDSKLFSIDKLTDKLKYNKLDDVRDNVHEVNNELTNMNAAANCIITVTLLILTLMRPITISYV